MSWKALTLLILLLLTLLTVEGSAGAAPAAALAAPRAALALVEVLVLTMDVVTLSAVGEDILPLVAVTMESLMMLTEVLLIVTVSKTTCMVTVLLRVVLGAAERLEGGIESTEKEGPYGAAAGP